MRESLGTFDLRKTWAQAVGATRMPTPRSPFTSEIEKMLAAATRSRVSAKSVIVREGDTPAALFFILRGSVTVVMEDFDGRELIISYLGPGEFFGEMGLFNPAAKRSAFVRARMDCEIAQISYDRFKQLIREEPELLLQLTAQLAERLRATSEKLGHLAFLDVTGRVARALLQLAHDSQAMTHPDGMLVRITREELGRLVNCSREMTGKVLRSLEGQGLIQVDGKSIVVIDGSGSLQAPSTAPSRPTPDGDKT
jgi:CRP/FNR family cyclic AMP-dependent transcriptional regulator